jgi:hypothetical protein
MGSSPATAIGSGSGSGTVSTPSSYASLADPTYNGYTEAATAQGVAGISTQEQYNAGIENNYALALNQLTAPELASYTSYLNQLTSADPTQRMSAVAPQVTAIDQQTQQAVQNISQLPRGGANAALTAEAYQSEAAQVGNALNTAYNAAQQQIGNLGEFGVQATESGFGTASSALANSASTLESAAGLKAQQQAAAENLGVGAASGIAGLIGML